MALLPRPTGGLSLGLIVAAALTLPRSASAQTPTPSAGLQPSPGPPPMVCATDSNARRFDFWVGEWEVTTASGQPAGTSRITRIPSQCALYEEWTAGNGGSGRSLTAYNPILKTWQQFYVGHTGRVQEYRTGYWQDSSLVLVAETPAGQTSYPWQRMTFTPLGPDLVRQFGELSFDGGTTWRTGYDLYYHRRK